MSYSESIIQAIQNEDVEAIPTYLQKAITNDSTNDLYLLADSFYRLGFLNETKEVLQHLLTVHPEDDEIKINLAEIAIEEGEDLTAFEILQNIEETSPAYVQSLLVLADYYQVQELPEVSEQKLLEAQNLLPEEPIITFALAELHFIMGKYAQAIRGYEEILTNGDEGTVGVQITARLGSAYSVIGDFENAVGYLGEAIEGKEDIDTIFQLAFTYFQQEEYQRANELFNQVKTMDHTYTSLYPYLAKGLEEEQDLEAASEVIEEGLIQDNTNYQLYVIGANIELKQENAPKAEEYYKKAMALEPENESLTIEYTNLLLLQERFEEAIEVIQEALQELDADPQFYWNLAISQNELEEFEAAKRAFEKAYLSFDTNADFLKDYFLFLQEEGQREKMKEVGSKYLEIKPNDDEIQEVLNRLEDDWL